MAERDYAKFLKDGTRLNIRLIPRPVYVEMVKAHRQKEDVIELIFDELFWLWDLNALAKSAQEAGREVTRAQLADEMISEMSDDDWWKVIAAFEEHLMNSFHENPQEWTAFLDPVYDMQEQAGWTQQQ